ncbi:MAG: LysM peptidoglycan-binding domain-containing protein [Chloroflexi bacterium]|nr:LysM peptidoglycan-binding domain-containing protein [Chloroflexota bacterium]MBV9131545.1 LysM peptidoglycan-binding domain-containing protein [Chloroflexota bacterium]MBV9895488.1 LysM peptidoglycan-binding domain-containing protein [Chloroflexota bacterium]
MKQRLIAVGAGLILVLVVARIILTGSGSGGEVAVDTTGASAQRGTPGVRNGNAPATTTPVAGRTPAAAQANGPTPTPLVVQIQGTAVSIEARPLVLLNPSTVRQGSSVGVTGSGFDPGATLDIYVKQQVTDSVDPLTFVQVDKSGGFGGVTFAVPDSLPRGSFVVQARERESDNAATATAVIAGGSPQVKLGTQAAKSGDTIQLSASGFDPTETITVYWNDLSSDSIGTVQTDEAGTVRQGSVRVPFGAVGNNAFVFVGDKSQSPVTVAFQLLNLYPSVDLSSYAIKPDNVLSFSGKDFGPGEQVTVFLNDPDTPALTTIQTDDTGGFTNSGGFLVPFGLQGKQTLIFVGSQSKAPTTASFDTLPYTPSAQPSTYGGRPGTTLTFYAIGFARNEIVHAFVGRTDADAGQEVSCFRTDGQGNAASGGSYVVPGDASPGQLVFTLIGSRSQAAATAALEVIASDVPVQVPPQAPFACDLTDGPDAPQVVGVVQGPPVSAGAVAAAAAGATADTPAPEQTSPTAVPKPSPNVRAAASTTPQATPAPTKGSPTPAKGSPTPAKRSTPAPSVAATLAATAAPASPPSATYAVKAGDTLPSIAAAVYGDANQWKAIYDANKAAIGNDPNVLQAGTQLTLPPKESGA